MATMFGSIYVDPFDIDDPCEKTPELCYRHASKVKNSLLECFDKCKKKIN